MFSDSPGFRDHTQFASVANVTFPNVYQKFLDGVDFLNFDLTWAVSAGCFVKVDFHDRLLWTTISPIVAMCLLGGTYTISVFRNRGAREIVFQNTQHKHASMVLLATFLVYSSVSSVVFQMFACDDLDDRKRYLRADYSIDCDSPKHEALQIYAGFMILLYPVGIYLPCTPYCCSATATSCKTRKVGRNPTSSSNRRRTCGSPISRRSSITR